MSKSSLFSFNVANNRQPEKAPPKIFAVTSGKGGVGKTNISVNMAILLKRLKKNVLLFDADIHLGNVDLFLGLRPKYTIADAVSNDMPLEDIILKGPEDIDVLPASSAVMDVLENEDEVVSQLVESFKAIEDKYDVIVVDTGAGISGNVIPFILAADKVLVTVTRDPASIADAYGMIKIIRKMDGTMPIMVAANMVNDESEAESLFKKMNLMVNRFLNSNIYYGGAILEDKLVRECIRRQLPITLAHPQASPSRSLKILTMNMIRMQTFGDEENVSFLERFMNNRAIEIGDEV